MKARTADSNYQALGAEYSVGDLAVPYGASSDFAGKVVEVFPAIGMVEVQFPMGNKRYPVEDLQRLDPQGHPVGRESDTVPGGAGTVSVPGGPVATRVAQAFVKKSLYWAARDRRYRLTAEELSSGTYTCPKCKEAQLRKAVYRRTEGASEHLFGCPSCMFLIERDALIHPEGV